MLTIIASSLSSILGILFAVLLVASELTKKRYPSSSFKSLFSDKDIMRLFQIFISTILISIYTLLALNPSTSSQVINDNLTHFSLILFMFCLLYIYPTLKKVIISTVSKTEIKTLANQINIQHVFQLDQNRARSEPTMFYSFAEDNPIIKLSEISMTSIKSGDIITPKIVIGEATNALISLLDRNNASYDTRNYISGFSAIFNVTVTHAIKSDQRGTLSNVINSYERIHKYCAENKFPHYELTELNEQLKAIISRIIKSNLDDVAHDCIWSIRNIFGYHLRHNIPEEKDITFFSKNYENPNRDLDSQWHAISTEYLRMIYYLTKECIALGKGDLTIKFINCLSSIPEMIERSSLGNQQIKSMYQSCYYYLYDLAVQSIKSGIINEFEKPSIFSMLHLTSLIKSEKDCVQVPFHYFGEYLFILTENRLLDQFLLNEFIATGRTCLSENSNSKLNLESILYIISILSRIKDKLEGMEDPFRSKLYVELYYQVGSLIKWQNTENFTNERVQNELSALTNSFNRIDEFKLNMNELSVEWPGI
ncbi:hypothetical protein E3V55_00575 [Candidatus Marinimicrobia bacterium MT.SAG.3]|nr:hypothetical protein E3V55_00575 [Candidatus Marinimicrobia bacterium MT.SAG.3]